MIVSSVSIVCYFFNKTATTETYTDLHTLSLRDALPILPVVERHLRHVLGGGAVLRGQRDDLEQPGLLALSGVAPVLDDAHVEAAPADAVAVVVDRKSTRLNSSH